MIKVKLIKWVLSLNVSDRAVVALQILESIPSEDSVNDHELLMETERRDKAMDSNNENTFTEEEFSNSFADRIKRLA